MTDFWVYLLKNSSGRDKLLGIAENLAIARSSAHVHSGERWTRMKVVEADLSQCRKAFRLGSSFPDLVHSRKLLRRFFTDCSLDAAKSCQLLLEAAGSFSSGMYGVYDHVAWAISVGLLRGATIPHSLATFAVAKRNEQIVGKDDAVVRFIGGSSGLKRRKNFWSLYRIIFMLVYEGIWYGRQAFKAKGEGMSFSRTYVAGIHATQVFTLLCHCLLLSARLFRSSLPRALLLSPFRMALVSIAANLSTLTGAFFEFQLMLRVQRKQRKYETQMRAKHARHKQKHFDQLHVTAATTATSGTPGGKPGGTVAVTGEAEETQRRAEQDEEEFAARGAQAKQQVLLMTQLKGSIPGGDESVMSPARPGPGGATAEGTD